MSDDFLPCPFCGGTDIRCDDHGPIGNRFHQNDHVWSMCCYGCGATFPNRYKRELLVEDWNRRVVSPDAKVQQVLAMDELTVAELGQAWLDNLCKAVTPERFPAEVTCEHVKDTTVQTLWCRQRPVAIVVRQRNDWNYAVATLVRIGK